MRVNVLASGSKGNATALTDGKVTILLDTGIGYRRLMERLNFNKPQSVLITHEHGDHVHLGAITQLMVQGTDVYMTAGTKRALDLSDNPRLHEIAAFAPFELSKGNLKTIKSYAAVAFPSWHDAAEPVNFVITNAHDRIWYITDDGAVNLGAIWHTYPLNRPTKIIVEANYENHKLFNSNVDKDQRNRILQFHSSIEGTLDFLDSVILDECEEIHLVHISSRHGDKELFEKRVMELPAVKQNFIQVIAH